MLSSQQQWFSSSNFAMLPPDVLQNILTEWASHDPADSVRFSLTSKTYYNALHHVVEPLRIAIVHKTGRSHGEALGDGRAWFVSTKASKESGAIVKASATLAYGTEYMFFRYHEQRQERMHLGRHVQINANHDGRFGLALFRPDELIQYWTMRPVLEEEEESTTVLRRSPDGTAASPSRYRCKLSVVGSNKRTFDREDPNGPQAGFLRCSIDGDEHQVRQEEERRSNWYVKNVDQNSSYEQTMANADSYEIEMLNEGGSPKAFLRSRLQSSYPVMVYPKAVFNRGGTVCLYDPTESNDHDCFPGASATVSLRVWIESSRCRLHAPILPFKISIPIVAQDDGMGDDGAAHCDARRFISSLYRNRSARIDYLIYYFAVAADAQERARRGRGGWPPASSANDMRRQTLTHSEHTQREETDENGDHWFILDIPGVALERSVPDQPSDEASWYATLGP